MTSPTTAALAESIGALLIANGWRDTADAQWDGLRNVIIPELAERLAGWHPGGLTRKEYQAEVDAVWRRAEKAEKDIDAALALAKKCGEDRDHWKANHDHMAEVKRAVLDRPDLGERATLVQKLVAARDSALARISAAEVQIAGIRLRLIGTRSLVMEALAEHAEEGNMVTFSDSLADKIHDRITAFLPTPPSPSKEPTDV